MPRFAFTAVPLAALLILSACGEGTGTQISINSTDADGNVVLGSDANGQMAIDTPLFKGKFTLPKLKLDADTFDMNGVHLYPGSTISAMNIAAHQQTGSKDDANVRIAFASPAAPATVRDWFKDKLTAADFKVTAAGNGLVGTTDDDKPFKLDLTADGNDTSKGAIVIG